MKHALSTTFAIILMVVVGYGCSQDNNPLKPDQVEATSDTHDPALIARWKQMAVYGESTSGNGNIEYLAYRRIITELIRRGVIDATQAVDLQIECIDDLSRSIVNDPLWLELKADGKYHINASRSAGGDTRTGIGDTRQSGEIVFDRDCDSEWGRVPYRFTGFPDRQKTTELTITTPGPSCSGNDFVITIQLLPILGSVEMCRIAFQGVTKLKRVFSRG